MRKIFMWMGFYVELILKLGRYCNMESRQRSTGWCCNKPQSQRSISHQLLQLQSWKEKKKNLSSHISKKKNCTKWARIRNWRSFQAEFKGLWQLPNSGPSSADTTGGHRDIKQPKKRNITSTRALHCSAPHTWLWHTCTANQQLLPSKLWSHNRKIYIYKYKNI